VQHEFERNFGQNSQCEMTETFLDPPTNGFWYLISITLFQGYDEDKEYGDYYDYDYEDYDEEDYTENEEDYGEEVYMIFSSNHVSALSAVLDSAILTNF
jgi:hypothetical protein